VQSSPEERRVAALYDVHGNLPALRAVLAELDEVQPDLVVVGGDVCWGPMPRETLIALRSLGEDAVYVRGNADREVGGRVTEGADPAVADVTAWCADQLDDEQKAFLSALPPVQVVDVTGLGRTLFCHGSPRSDEESITDATPEREVEDMLKGVDERTVVCGHTHAHFDRRVADRRVVNAGSVGLQFGSRGAHWALLGPDVELRVSEYDVEAAAEEIRRSGCPQAEEFAAHALSPPPARAALDASPRQDKTDRRRG
jgi:predicted phosphodiesterase